MQLVEIIVVFIELDLGAPVVVPVVVRLHKKRSWCSFSKRIWNLILEVSLDILCFSLSTDLLDLFNQLVDLIIS